jgi:hypothetical protein
MSVKDNMAAAGYAPASEVALALGKALSTVHRMVEKLGLDHQRDDRFLYVSVKALVEHYRARGDNTIVLQTLLPLAKSYGVRVRDVD